MRKQVKPKQRNPVAAFSRHRHAVHKVKPRIIPRRRKHKKENSNV